MQKSKVMSRHVRRFISLTNSFAMSLILYALTPQACHKLTIFYCVKNNNIVYIHLHSAFFLLHCVCTERESDSSCGSSNVQINPYRMSLEACLADGIESRKFKHKLADVKRRKGCSKGSKFNFS